MFLSGEAEELVHCLLICVGEWILIELRRADPAEIFYALGDQRTPFGERGFVERERDAIAVVLVDFFAGLLAEAPLGVEALAQLAAQRVLVVLAGLDLAAGKLPQVSQHRLIPPLR